MAGEDLTSRYKGYAIYLPSLQQGYAAFAHRTDKSVREGNLPKGLKIADLDFLSESSNLWHCGYTLYSAGQFTRAQIRTPDMVSERAENTVVLGDSGGYQIGTGKHPSLRDWTKIAKQPDLIVKRWLEQQSIRDTILRWLDSYSDYAMTLDMPLWILTEQKSITSPFANLTAEQLIELSVENLRYFADNRGKATGKQAKFLNVLQDAGNGTGDAWYDAVKDFDFEGWAFGGDTKTTFANVLRWMKRLLDDQKLDACEWIHVLMASPPVSGVYLTAMQRALSKAAGCDIQVSYDSSTPFQMSGIRQMIAKPPKLEKAIGSWRVGSISYPQEPKYADKSDIRYLEDVPSPITKLISINDFHAKQTGWEQTFFDSLSSYLLTNHNIYVYHRAAVDANDLLFSDEAQDHSRVPDRIADGVGLIEEAFQVENFDTWLTDNNDALGINVSGATAKK